MANVYLRACLLAICAIIIHNQASATLQFMQQQQQDYGSKQHRRERVSWCTTNLLEKKKCLDWARAIEDVNIQLEGQEPFKMNLDCVQGADKDQCMGMIDDERADMILLDPGEIGVAGRYHSLTPIMVERYGMGKSETGHYSVAVVKKRSNIYSLADLYGKRACFTGVSHMASWTLPLSQLIDLPKFEIVDCNNLVKSASYFFGNSCAPNALINKFNPTGDNPQSMYILCDRPPNRHNNLDEIHSGPLHALRCLADPIVPYGADYKSLAGGDVAFLPHNTVFLTEKLNLPREMRLELPSRSDLELLCPQGGRMPLERWQSCNFGFVPAHAVIVSSRTSTERRENIQRFLKISIQIFSGTISPFTSSDSSTQVIRQQSSSQQQQQQSPFDFGYPDSGSYQPYSTSSPRDASLDRILNGIKLNTNFKLNGDHSFLNYPSLDVLFSSDMSDLVPLVGAGQTFKGFLNSFPVQVATKTSTGARVGNQPGDLFSPFASFSDTSAFDVKIHTDYFEKLRRCSVPAAVLCVTSDKEFNKCQAMSKAFHAASLRPELHCKLATSTLSCMQLIKNRDADLVSLDAADIYLAGTRFGLVPILAEQIEMYESSYYAVAIAKKSDRSTDLFNLKGKLTCHSGFLKGAGWVMPINFLLSNEKLREYEECDSARSAAEHFDKACAPGILSSISSIVTNPHSWTIRNMCELCHGTGRNYCARDASEPFFGDTGAFRCLVEGGGQVAFAKHTAIFENTGGSNRETWARNLIKSDFELLCRDGSRKPVNEYKTCNLGIVPPSAIVTRGGTPLHLVDAYVNLFMYGQQYYGSKYSEEYSFKMFSSTFGRDLIFQDATQQLVRVPLANQTFNSYLNYEFLRAIKTVFDCK